MEGSLATNNQSDFRPTMSESWILLNAVSATTAMAVDPGMVACGRVEKTQDPFPLFAHGGRRMDESEQQCAIQYLREENKVLRPTAAQPPGFALPLISVAVWQPKPGWSEERCLSEEDFMPLCRKLTCVLSASLHESHPA